MVVINLSYEPLFLVYYLVRLVNRYKRNNSILTFDYISYYCLNYAILDTTTGVKLEYKKREIGVYENLSMKKTFNPKKSFKPTKTSHKKDKPLNKSNTRPKFLKRSSPKNITYPKTFKVL